MSLATDAKVRETEVRVNMLEKHVIYLREIIATLEGRLKVLEKPVEKTSIWPKKRETTI